MLATLAEDLPSGEGWLFEPKWDGYRALGYVRGGEATLVSRNGNDLTERFAPVAKELPKALRTPDAVVDGEVVRARRARQAELLGDAAGQPARLVYEVFDVLEVDGEPLVDLPLTERRARLEELLVRANPVVQLSGFFDDGEALLEAAKEQGLEGVMAKRGGVARTRRGSAARLAEDQDARAAGVRDLRLHEGPGPARGQLRLARARRPPRREWAWVGNVGTGFGERDDRRAAREARPLEREDVPVPGRPEDAEGAER